MAQPSPAPQGRHHRAPVTGWVGWVLFAGLVMFTTGFFNIIEGLVALFNHGYYRARTTDLAIHANYATWGWTLLLLGVVLAFAGYGVMVGQTWARAVGVVAAVVNAVVNIAFIKANPVWITLTVALDVLVIYALVVHGREARALRG
jgi:hypothetical protein